MVRTTRRGLLQAVGAAAGLGAAGTLAACVPLPGGQTPSGATGGASAPPATNSPTAATTTPAASAGLRLVTASDGHLGEPGTDSRRFLEELVDAVNTLHATAPVDIAVLNGDIGHGGAALLREAKKGLDRLEMPYLVTQGNHDEVSPAEWEDIWGAPGDQVYRLGRRSLVLANTSNEAGDYLCADQDWLAQALSGEAGQQDVLVFMHITPNTWTKWGIACPGVRRVLAGAPNVRAVFNGHDHDQGGVKVDEGVHYFFDAHYGGHWGTSYRAFRLVELGEGHLGTRLVTTTGERRSGDDLRW